MKKDAEKKDELIKELSLANRQLPFDKDRHDPFIGQDRTILDVTRRELEQYRLKVDTLSHDVCPFFASLPNLLLFSFSYVMRVSNSLPKMNE